MSRNLLKVFVGVAVMVFFGAALAFAAKGKTISVFYDTSLPNGQQLKAGEYTVEMVKDGHAVQFTQKGKVIAEMPCNCHQVEKKHGETQIIFTKNANGKEVLQELRLKGDTKNIVFEAEGM
jgi:hypothetical protein